MALSKVSAPCCCGQITHSFLMELAPCVTFSSFNSINDQMLVIIVLLLLLCFGSIFASLPPCAICNETDYETIQDLVVRTVRYTEEML